MNKSRNWTAESVSQINSNDYDISTLYKSLIKFFSLHPAKIGSTEISSGRTTSWRIVVATVTKSQSPDVEKTRGWPGNTNDRITRPRLTSHEKARKILCTALSRIIQMKVQYFTPLITHLRISSNKLITYIN